MESVALFGYSGHTFVVADAINQIGYKLIGYYDKNESKTNPYNLKYLGDVNNEVALSIISESGASFSVSIGDNSIRRIVIQHLNKKGFVIALIVHPASTVSKLATNGIGSFVAAVAVVNPLAKIGLGAIINTSAVVEHECIIGITHTLLRGCSCW
ncbi:PglD-related sugar-binding protein [Pontibacter amylolyticus]|uniref:PglD N-terminal domain-containing protein n=1 Tax=Pontibacter amylolyticus TaxID=1424080 RepID=A0ABQ1WCW6_9BACT|nr:hypothetical protein [Pontibacter amylolyticus]GGG25223.1 hypothetical protein GCM10011323_31250 [Pontibacter amylolyticus]